MEKTVSTSFATKNEKIPFVQGVKKDATVQKDFSGEKIHKIELDNHRHLSVSGVKGVPTFSDKEIKIQLDGESLLLTGHSLEIKLLDLDKGTLVAGGYVSAMKYLSSGTDMGILKRLTK